MILGIKDSQTVTPEGTEIAKVPFGVVFHEIITHTDSRGTLFELFNTQLPWHDAPLVYAYGVTLRPGMIKGWALHKKHEDRYALLFGEMEVVLYDDRPESPTRGLVSTVILSEHQRRAMSIPVGVWHADHNIGSKDVVLLNFPTQPYDHADPDKYRLPLDTDLIPYKFNNPVGY